MTTTERKIVVENFTDGVMSAVIGEAVTLDENKALEMVAGVKARADALEVAETRAKELRAEADRLDAETAEGKDAVNAASSEILPLIEKYVACARKSGRAVPAALAEFVGDVPAPAPTAESDAMATPTAPVVDETAEVAPAPVVADESAETPVEFTPDAPAEVPAAPTAPAPAFHDDEA